MRRLRSVAVAIAIALTATAAGAKEPPCPAMPPGSAGAFREGIVDGQWVGVVLNEVGGGGGALSAIVFTLDQYGALAQLGPVRVLGPRGDNMDAKFIGGKLYLFNASYTNADRLSCASHLAVQRFGIRHVSPPTVALAREGVALVATPRKPNVDQKLRDELPAATYR